MQVVTVYSQNCDFKSSSFSKYFDVDTTFIDSLFNEKLYVVEARKHRMKTSKMNLITQDAFISIKELAFYYTSEVILPIYLIDHDKETHQLTMFIGEKRETLCLTLIKLCDEGAVFSVSVPRKPKKYAVGENVQMRDIGYLILRWK